MKGGDRVEDPNETYRMLLGVAGDLVELAVNTGRTIYFQLAESVMGAVAIMLRQATWLGLELERPPGQASRRTLWDG